MSLRAKRPRLNQRLSLEMPIRGLSWTGVRFSAPPPEEEASNSSFTRTSLRLCIGWGTPDGVPLSVPVAVKRRILRFKTFLARWGTRVPLGLFSCLKTPLKRSEGCSSALVHLAFARCKGGRPAGGGWMWADVQKGCGMGLVPFCRPFVNAY